jgi:hypothetical protein
MKSIRKIILTAVIFFTPALFNGCSNHDNDNAVGRDKNVPNNIEDNYTKDEDAANKTPARVNENEEQTYNHKTRNPNRANYKNSLNSLETRISNLEKEVAKMRKNEKVGQK